MADERTEKQKVQEITDKLEEGLKELFESEKYKTYLSTMSKFHNYSFNNTLLIAMQKPEATLVAGYKAWQKNFERHVNKGEKAIRILAPAPYKIKEERDKLDPVTGEMMFDENGMPQKEQVEVTIPAFRAVSVFDVSQTDGKPIPELEAQELLSTVEGYEDFVQALMNVAPVPIGFEDIPGDSKGYFHTEKKRIAVQENMSESQTLKTMVHEVAHSMLHNKEINRDDLIEEPAKDRNTKEVEAESVAYTVCQHFGIDTSDYSFGYIAGWSSGKDMKELKSSLDTIRKTASELITGIEGALRELQLNREMEQEQSKECILLIQNEDLTEFSLVNVRGMDTQELVAALTNMNEDDKLSIQAYLESKGAWTTELGNDKTREFEEYHLDVRYNLDTDEIIDVSIRQEREQELTQQMQTQGEMEKEEVEVTLMVSECGEFHNLGEFYENIPTVEEAIAIWKQIPPERMHGIPAIGINVHRPGEEIYMDDEVDLLSGNRIDLEILEHIPSITCEPKAMEVIAELVAKLPEMEIDGVMSEDMEAMVWEKRMPDLGPAEQLAVEIDRFSYDYDVYSYRNNNPNMTESVSEISEMIVQGNTEPITDWLNEVISEGALPDEMQRTKVLLEKLAEYKPLAKIEEMEEQNYNMIDNVLNNGAEKAQREANKKNQEQSAVKVSLKARLAEKKAQVEGSGQEHEVQENTKKNQREI